MRCYQCQITIGKPNVYVPARLQFLSKFSQQKLVIILYFTYYRSLNKIASGGVSKIPDLGLCFWTHIWLSHGQYSVGKTEYGGCILPSTSFSARKESFVQNPCLKVSNILLERYIQPFGSNTQATNFQSVTGRDAHERASTTE